MPVYAIHCLQCGATGEAVRSIAERHDLPECCGAPMQLAITAPRIMRDIAEYESLLDGTMITSRSHHREHMKANGVEELGDAPTASMEPEKHRKEVDWQQATIEAAEYLTQTKDSKWLKKNLT